MRWAEAEGLLRVNNGNQMSFGSSYNFTTRLARGTDKDAPAKLSEVWGASNNQETVGISPAMYREFCLPYYRQACEPMGLLYYGCCEPAHPFWDEIRTLPHLARREIDRFDRTLS